MEPERIRDTWWAQGVALVCAIVLVTANIFWDAWEDFKDDLKTK